MNLRPRTRRTVATVLAALGTVAMASSLVSCATDDLGLQQWPDAPNPTLALPNGSQLSDNVDDLATSPEVNGADNGGTPYGSLRPDTDGDSGEERSAEERVPDIVDRGRLIVGVAQSLNQLGFRDPVTGELAGFEIDLAREIARDIFDDPDRIEYRYVEDSTPEEALSAGGVDLVIRSFTVTAARQEQVEFSVPYLTTYPRVLVMRNSGITSEADLADKTVCVTRESTNLESLRDDIPHQDILATLTWSDCLMAVQRQQADAIYSDSAILSGLQAQDPYTEIVGDSDNGSDYGVTAALPQDGGSAGLVRQVNSTMERLRDDGTWEDIYSRWLEEFLGPADQPAAVYRGVEENNELAGLRAGHAEGEPEDDS